MPTDYDGDLDQQSVRDIAWDSGLTVANAFYVESTGSTNADLMAAADAGAPEWTVLVAGHQTEGRGRMGRRWEAPPGSSLLVSVLLRPGIEPVRAPVLSMFAAITMAQGIEELTPVGMACDWPNDLLTRDGRKVGGLLLESRIEDGVLRHVVIGLGLNLTQTADDFPPDLRRPATSLALEGATPRPRALLGAFLFRLHDRLLKGPMFDDWATSTFRRRCTKTIGGTVRVTTTDGAVVEGTAVDIGERGELLVETSEGLVAVSSGELERLG